MNEQAYITLSVVFCTKSGTRVIDYNGGDLDDLLDAMDRDIYNVVVGNNKIDHLRSVSLRFIRPVGISLNTADRKRIFDTVFGYNAIFSQY
jgi:hypothetical protein